MCSGIWFRNLLDYKMPNTYHLLSFAIVLAMLKSIPAFQLDTTLVLLELGFLILDYLVAVKSCFALLSSLLRKRENFRSPPGFLFQ